MVDKGQEINKLIKGTFGTELGRRLANHLKTQFVDRPVYIPGHTHDETAYREGQRNVIMQILKEIENE